MNKPNEESENELVTTGTAMIASREIEAKITVALKFPRSLALVTEDIKAMCMNPRFADGSTYVIPRGGKTVSGPSVHFAKGVANLYRNIEHGSKIDRVGPDYTAGHAFAWDYQNNIKITKDFYMKHERKANNAIKKVTDPAELLEMLNAQIARAVRNCILEIMPWYILEEAQEICAKTLREEQKKTPIEKRREEAKKLFEGLGINDEKLRKKMNKTFLELTDEDLFELKKAYTALRDKFITVAQWMGEVTDDAPTNSDALNDKFLKKEAPKESTTTEPVKDSPQKLDEKNMVDNYFEMAKKIK